MQSLSHVQFFATTWTVDLQASLSLGFPRQKYWRGLPFPSPGIFLTQGSNPGLLNCRQILYFWATREAILYKFSCTLWWFDVCMYCKMLTTIRPLNRSFTSHDYHFVCYGNMLIIYSYFYFQVYNTIQLTIVTMLYFRSKVFLLQLFPLTNISSFPPPFISGFCI